MYNNYYGQADSAISMTVTALCMLYIAIYQNFKLLPVLLCFHANLMNIRIKCPLPVTIERAYRYTECPGAENLRNIIAYPTKSE